LHTVRGNKTSNIKYSKISHSILIIIIIILFAQIMSKQIPWRQYNTVQYSTVISAKINDETAIFHTHRLPVCAQQSSQQLHEANREAWAVIFIDSLIRMW